MKILMVFLVSLFSFSSMAEDFSPLGVWLVGSGKAKVEIYEKDSELEGKIIWLKEPLNAEGQPKLDKENPDKEAKTKPIMGMILVKGFKKEEANYWSGGTVYDAESGKTYKATLKMAKADEIKLRGYVGITLFGKTDTWTRSSLTP